MEVISAQDQAQPDAAVVKVFGDFVALEDGAVLGPVVEAAAAEDALVAIA